MRTLVFFSPVVPDFRFQGLAMRAAQNLRALAGHFRIHLRVLDLYGPERKAPPEDVVRFCASWRIQAVPAGPRPSGWRRWTGRAVPEEWREPDRASLRRLSEEVRALEPDAAWCFRFYLAPWVLPAMEGGAPVWLDVDEVESSVRRRQAKAGLDGEAEAAFYQKQESRLLPRFARIFAASGCEAECLRARVLPPVAAWPNVVDIPAQPEWAGPRQGQGRAVFLFVGSLGHAPNRDAIHYMLEEILPRYRARAGREGVLAVAGRAAAAHAGKFSGRPGLRWLGELEDLAPHYRECDAVVVPLRSGGGTRIKILEAFAHGCPVVSTPLGAEGLEVVDKRELLLAEGPENFATALQELLEKPERAAALSRASRDWAARLHSPAVLDRAARELAHPSGG